VYLSKIMLNWPACRNPYEWHRLIWKLFPDKPDAKRNFQFVCLDRRPGCNIPVLLFSLEKPACIQTQEIILIGESKRLTSLFFKSGQRLSFRLTANPTKVITEQTEEKRKVRVPLIKQDQQESWLKRHLDGCAEIETVNLRNETPIWFNRNNKGGKIVPVVFEGVLKVVNSEEFKKRIYEKYDENGAYIAGIGPAKAFGCGLLLVKPA